MRLELVARLGPVGPPAGPVLAPTHADVMPKVIATVPVMPKVIATVPIYGGFGGYRRGFADSPAVRTACGSKSWTQEFFTWGLPNCPRGMLPVRDLATGDWKRMASGCYECSEVLVQVPQPGGTTVTRPWKDTDPPALLPETARYWLGEGVVSGFLAEHGGTIIVGVVTTVLGAIALRYLLK